jgi:Cys-rich repeat protein
MFSWKSVFLITFILLSLLINNCICSSSKNTIGISDQGSSNKEISDKEIHGQEIGNKEEITLPESCLTDSDCPTGFSCWYELPKGPLPGTPGSKDKPGKCYRDETIRKIY